MAGPPAGSARSHAVPKGSHQVVHMLLGQLLFTFAALFPDPAEHLHRILVAELLFDILPIKIPFNFGFGKRGVVLAASFLVVVVVVLPPRESRQNYHLDHPNQQSNTNTV